ncbi:MAG: HEAT repeat domain-containing protein [Planctomycetota bacterium]|nr:HEAT repeat domain-containing protein [Planctomycetota bacterium]
MKSVALLLPLLALAVQDDPAKDLKSKDFETRIAAVHRLERNEHPKREKLLIGALKDDDWEVVEDAAIALGKVGGEDSVGALAKLALEGPVRRVRRTAAESLAAIDATAGFEALAKKVSGKEAEHACQGMWSLAPKIDGRVSLKPASKALKSKEAPVRAAAAKALVLLAGEERPARLEGLLAHEEVRVRAAVIEAAGEVGDAACLGLLLAELRKAGLRDVIERRVIAACRGILAAAADSERAALGDKVARAVIDATSEESRARTARLVGRLASGGKPLLGKDRALEALAPALDGGHPKARAAAAGALGRIGTDGALERAMRMAADDSNANVRLIAMLAVLRSKDATDDATRKLLADRLAKDPDPTVREEAATALGTKGVEKALRPLVAALADAEWGVQVCAAVSLGKTRQPGAVGTLSDLYRQSDDWRLRGAAVVGLGHLYLKEAVPVVIEALEDDETIVQRTAHEWLSSIAGPELGRDSKEWREWWNENERRLQLFDPEEDQERRDRYGYERTPAEIYEGLDVIVFESRGDHIQNILDDIGVEHRLTQQGQVKSCELHPRAVFVSNCTGEMVGDDIDRLAWFLRTGGYLFGSCWAVQETIERVYPGVVRRLPTRGEVLDDVLATPCVDDSPYLEGVFGLDVEPMYALEGAYLIEVVDPERCEVLIDSPECADRHGEGNLAVWFTVGHGVVLDSVNHFEEQGLKRATWLKKPEERMAFAVDHMGLTYEELRKSRGEKFWKKSTQAAEIVKDLSVFRIITNFVRQKRIAGDG